MEVLLSIALFALVAVALTQALGQLGRLSVEGRIDLHVMNGLQSALHEFSKVRQLEETQFVSDPDDLGVIYESTVEEVELENMDGQLLEDMWRIRVRALWRERGQEREEIAEVFRYGPLYQTRL